MSDSILIIDFGSQVTQLIARRLREAGVYTEILPCTTSAEKISAAAPNGIILSGGPNSVALADTPRAPQIVFDLGVPVLGICYGQQTMCAQLGGRVEPGTSREFGRAVLDITAPCSLFEGFWLAGGQHTVWMSHGDHVAKLPDGFNVVATSAGAPLPRWRMNLGTITACSFIPRLCIPRMVPIYWHDLRLAFVAARAAGQWRPIAAAPLPQSGSRLAMRR